jgi:nitrogen regulatory protein PII
MKRIEIIANRSIEEDMFEAFEKAGIASHYTKIPEVMGVGKSGPRMGDHIWPEENFILIVYCEDEEAERIKKVIGELKEFFVNEGIKLFEISF